MVADPIFARERVTLMGVLNVTPDSFSDGGGFFEDPTGPVDVRSAVARGVELVSQGAHVLDVGGESTRPGARAVEAVVQIERVVPVISELARKVDVPISVDTRSAEVAESALAAGARLVNDVSGLKNDFGLAKRVAEANATLILGHMRGTPETMRSLCSYTDLREEIAVELLEAVDHALAAGVDRKRLVVDPGIGFAKDATQSFDLLGCAGWFGERLGLPVLVGPSRKSFLGTVVSGSASERDEATWAACAVAAYAGADALRVHDVVGAAVAARVGRAARDASSGPGLA